MPHKAIPELSQDARVITARLLDRLKNAGDVVPYTELSALIGADVQTRRRSALTRARRILARDHGIIVATVARHGVKRLAPSDVPMLGEQARRSIHRRARRAAELIVRGTNGHDLGEEGTKFRNSELASLGLIAESSSPKTTSLIQKATGLTERGLADTIALFAGGKK